MIRDMSCGMPGHEKNRKFRAGRSNDVAFLYCMCHATLFGFLWAVNLYTGVVFRQLADTACVIVMVMG